MSGVVPNKSKFPNCETMVTLSNTDLDCYFLQFFLNVVMLPCCSHLEQQSYIKPSYSAVV